MVKISILDIITIELERQNKSQKDLCEYLGMTKNTYTNWKAGKSSSYKKYLPEIAEYLNVSIDYLLGKEDHEQKKVPDLKANNSTLSEQEQTIIKIFREATEEDRLEMIASIINIKNNQQRGHLVYRAARSVDHREPTIERISESDLQKLRTAHPVTSEEDL